MIISMHDPSAQWDVLTEDEINVIKGRCEELLDWFTYLDAENLTNYEVVIPKDYLQRRRDKPCFDPHQMKDIADRFEEKGDIFFESEFDMTREQLILETYCSPIDCCLALTMAYCEVSGWPYSCDWSAIQYSNKTWTEEEQNEFDKLTREEAKRQWDATKAFVMDPSSTGFQPSDHMRQCAVMENQLKALMATADKVHAEMQELISAMGATALAEKHEEVVNERREAINKLVPPSLRERPSLTEEELAEIGL
ncbi:hypothetical protein OSTOST_20811 [Ostertagia ostertagi]